MSAHIMGYHIVYKPIFLNNQFYYPTNALSYIKLRD